MFRFSILFVFLFAYALHGQQKSDSRHSIIELLKQYKLEETGKAIDTMKNSFAKTLFEKELDYLTSGNLEYASELLAGSIKLDLRDSILFHISLGNYHDRKIEPDDAEYFKNYLTAFEIATRASDTLLANESLRGLNRYFLKNYMDSLLYKKYVALLPIYEKDPIDEFWSRYYALIYEMSYSSFASVEFKEMEEGFLNLEANTPDHPYFKGKIQHMLGIFYSYPPDPVKSRDYFEKAAQTYDSAYYYSNSRRIGTEISLAISDFKEKAYSKAISKLESSLENTFVKNDEELKSIIYDWLAQSYEQLPAKGKNALYYLKMKDSSENRLKMHAIVQKNREIEVKHQVAKKDRNIKDLEAANEGLREKFVAILPILGIISLLAIVAFVLFRRYKNRSSKLETEKSETLQKLDELKNIVIKNHITLKDKTKVYISDLMYIKSDDHYLNVYTSDDKNHFVRGKLSHVKQELPPNFIQCHRSYIVNSNFIKRINNESITLVDKTTLPLSRSYKKKF